MYVLLQRLIEVHVLHIILRLLYIYIPPRKEFYHGFIKLFVVIEAYPETCQNKSS